MTLDGDGFGGQGSTWPLPGLWLCSWRAMLGVPGRRCRAARLALRPRRFDWRRSSHGRSCSDRDSGGGDDGGAGPPAGGSGIGTGELLGSITTDVRLDADLICGDGIAVTIDADRVTLDLNGHNTGSVVVEGHDRATIEGRDGFVSGSVEAARCALRCELFSQ